MIKPLTCPVCQKPVPAQPGEETGLLPFCSQRCRHIDLFRWTEGKYAIVEDLAERPDLMAELLQEMEAADEQSPNANDDESEW